MKQSLFIIILTLFSISTGFASESEEEIPAWFPLLELGGVIVGIIVCGVVTKVYLGMKGGAIGEGFSKILVGVIAITAGVAINGINETFELMNEFSAEVVLELCIYVGLVFIGLGSQKIAKLA